MSEPIGYYRGEFRPAKEMTVSVFDTGFMQGVTVAEQIRTFGGKLFRLEQHLQRLQRSLEIVGVVPEESLERIGELATDIAARNHALVEDGDDIGLAIFVTPGAYASYSAFGPAGPGVGMYAFPMPFGMWAEKYETGQRLVTAQTRQVSTLNWPAELKCRSRMHYYLADREARAKDPNARALVLDLDGNVCEATTANLLIFNEQEGLVSPKQETILPGISLSTLSDLAKTISLPMSDRELSLEDFYTADEVLLCSTSPCVMSVVNIDGRDIGDGQPGPIVRRLLDAWSEYVGVNVVEQAKRFANRQQ